MQQLGSRQLQVFGVERRGGAGLPGSPVAERVRLDGDSLGGRTLDDVNDLLMILLLWPSGEPLTGPLGMLDPEVTQQTQSVPWR